MDRFPADKPTLRLTNTLSRQKEDFVPEDPANVRMYVCGPTVYDYAHIGNARPVVVFDVLYRLLRHLYGAEHVKYVRNITDVDDKINARAAAEGISIRELTEKTAAQFHADMRALGALDPDIEPRATEHIGEMKELIETLVEKGHAYVAEDHVLFDVGSMEDYGKLSGRSLEDMQAGARVEVAPYKKGPMDFVLWKPSAGNEPGWPSPCSIERSGRPGWHIECSAMAGKHLGKTFDIHGGGVDLVFPHHENEVAQSRCSHDAPLMAHYWLHNGFLQVEGEKMSKSLGNFVTVHELLETQKIGGRAWDGRTIRLVLLMTQYRQPLDFTEKSLQEADRLLDRWAELIAANESECGPANDLPVEVVEALCDDLNTPRAIAALHGFAREGRQGDALAVRRLAASLAFLGFETEAMLTRAAKGEEAKQADPELAIRVEGRIADRLAARAARNWAEADRIRDELAGEGIVLKDYKDGDTGEIRTSWEVKR
ncbi:cysteine--tRNA ligase [Stappia sp. F7233]|uniref:Cysteine--tRNA ligase n=1 Tax=Stappia albiluteola TaxID=2758565 RepID=A0A839AK26_9HYPH|nr:cysteine--tRNA ligase [Stappia albiluteola]MBA5779378.1 cysteine--tRNA ligase [Stappia albiluteola]